MSDVAIPDLSARVVSERGRAHVEITYDGRQPPLQLFAELEAVGWEPPVPVPPPASAIDWSRPDPAAGTRYTIRSYEVVGVARPRPGAADVEAVERILARRAGGSVNVGEERVVAIVPAARVEAVTNALPAYVRLHSTSQLVQRVEVRFRGSPSTLDVASVRLELLVPVEHAAALRSALDSIGVSAQAGDVVTPGG